MEKLSNYINGAYLAPVDSNYFDNFDPSMVKFIA
jgi:hypothetical protein